MTNAPQSFCELDGKLVVLEALTPMETPIPSGGVEGRGAGRWHGTWSQGKQRLRPSKVLFTCRNFECVVWFLTGLGSPRPQSFRMHRVSDPRDSKGRDAASGLGVCRLRGAVRSRRDDGAGSQATLRWREQWAGRSVAGRPWREK